MSSAVVGLSASSDSNPLAATDFARRSARSPRAKVRAGRAGITVPPGNLTDRRPFSISRQSISAESTASSKQTFSLVPARPTAFNISSGRRFAACVPAQINSTATHLSHRSISSQCSARQSRCQNWSDGDRPLTGFGSNTAESSPIASPEASTFNVSAPLGFPLKPLARCIAAARFRASAASAAMTAAATPVNQPPSTPASPSTASRHHRASVSACWLAPCDASTARAASRSGTSSG